MSLQLDGIGWVLISHGIGAGHFRMIDQLVLPAVYPYEDIIGLLQATDYSNL